MDFFADRHWNKLVALELRKLIENKQLISTDETCWFNLTKLMFKKYGALKMIELIDLAIAEESDKDWFENKYPKEIFIELFVNTPQIAVNKKQEAISKRNSNDSITSKISSKISIIGLADKYGLRPYGKPKRICPFHNDSNPSLSLNDEKGLFNCFGCSAQGNIIDFIYLLRKNNIQEVENGN